MGGEMKCSQAGTVEVLSDKCDACGNWSSRPITMPRLPCVFCAVKSEHAHSEYARALHHAVTEGVDRYGIPRLFVYGRPLDRLQLTSYVVDVREGRNQVFKVDLPSEFHLNVLREDKRAAEMMRLREENTQLLAENARLRRRLDK